jgi:hypothetical protein
VIDLEIDKLDLLLIHSKVDYYWINFVEFLVDFARFDPNLEGHCKDAKCQSLGTIMFDSAAFAF